MKRRIIITGGLAALFALLLALMGGPSVESSRQPNDLASFSMALATEVRPGDVVDDVEAVLGPGRNLTEAERRIAATALLRWQKERPTYYADGVEERDVFLRWDIEDGCTLQLQFRSGRLINHAPESYLQTASK